MTALTEIKAKSEVAATVIGEVILASARREIGKHTLDYERTAFSSDNAAFIETVLRNAGLQIAPRPEGIVDRLRFEDWMEFNGFVNVMPEGLGGLNEGFPSDAELQAGDIVTFDYGTGAESCIIANRPDIAVKTGRASI